VSEEPAPPIGDVKGKYGQPVSSIYIYVVDAHLPKCKT